MILAWRPTVRSAQDAAPAYAEPPAAEAGPAAAAGTLHLEEAPAEAALRHALETAVGVSRSTSGYLAFVEERRATGDILVCTAGEDRLRVEGVPSRQALGLSERIEQIAGGRVAELQAGLHLDVPVFDEGDVVAVVGLAGKGRDYEHADAWVAMLLAHRAWSLAAAQRRRQDGSDRPAPSASRVSAPVEGAGGRSEAPAAERGDACRSVVDAVDDLIFTVDRDLRLSGLYGRKAEPWLEALGQCRASAIGRPLLDLLGADAAVHEGAYTRALLGEHVVYEFAMGQTHFESSLSPLCDWSGAPIGVVAVNRDVGERRVLENQALLAQKLESIGQLAAGIAHEINTPIQYVSDNLRFLKDVSTEIDALLARCHEAGGTGGLTVAEAEYLQVEVPAAIDQSLEGVERVARIVRAMKAYSQPETGAPVGVDVNAAIETTVAVSSHEWKCVADIVLDLDRSIPLVACYPGEFNQAVASIVTNAAQAIAERNGVANWKKGCITISTRRDGDWVEMRVADTGGGIPERIRERIFDPFFTTKPVGFGTGQGLTLAHAAIVSRLGGTLTFETEMGSGTTFVVRLPAEAE